MERGFRDSNRISKHCAVREYPSVDLRQVSNARNTAEWPCAIAAPTEQMTYGANRYSRRLLNQRSATAQGRCFKRNRGGDGKSRFGTSVEECVDVWIPAHPRALGRPTPQAPTRTCLHTPFPFADAQNQRPVVRAKLRKLQTVRSRAFLLTAIQVHSDPGRTFAALPGL